MPRKHVENAVDELKTIVLYCTPPGGDKAEIRKHLDVIDKSRDGGRLTEDAVKSFVWLLQTVMANSKTQGWTDMREKYKRTVPTVLGQLGAEIDSMEAEISAVMKKLERKVKQQRARFEKQKAYLYLMIGDLDQKS